MLEVKNFLSFEEAREVVRKTCIRTQKEYNIFLGQNTSCLLPSHPQRKYKEYWVSWEDWTGKKKFINRHFRFWDFKSAREYVKKLGIKNQKEWFAKKNSLPSFIPHTPHQVYRDQWVSFGDWLGTNNTVGAQRKYAVNEDFFKIWSFDMAYVLGFWWADGCICYGNSGYRFRLTQHKDDEKLLRDISVAMGAKDYPIMVTHDKYCELSINSQKIYFDRIALGGKERKSRDINFPYVPEPYLSDFVRGYFDGDGCIYFHKDSNRYKSTIVCGSKNFMDGICMVLENNIHGFKTNIKVLPARHAMINGGLHKFSETYRINFGVTNTIKLGEFLYKNDGISLQRKYNKFLLARGKINGN